MVEIGADGVDGGGGEGGGDGKGEDTIGEGKALCGCSAGGGASVGLGTGTATGGGTGLSDGGSDGVGGDGVGGAGGRGGEVGGGRSTNDVVVVGMDTLSIVTPSARPATLGLFAKFVSVLTAVDTSYGLVLATVASTMTEPAATLSVIAVDATTSDVARRA